MKTVRVLSPIKAGGERQPIGRELPLDAATADELERLGAVEILNDTEVVPAAPAEPSPTPAEPEAKPAAKRAAKKAD